MTTHKKQLQIVAPVGDVPSRDKELHSRLSRLPKDAPLCEVFKEVSEWEKIAVKNFRKQELTKKSGRLGARRCE